MTKSRPLRARLSDSEWEQLKDYAKNSSISSVVTECIKEKMNFSNSSDSNLSDPEHLSDSKLPEPEQYSKPERKLIQTCYVAKNGAIVKLSTWS